MVGPFMQGALLMGIIYWYTKGMLSLINDYYRSEIQRKMQTNEPLNETSDFIYVDQIVAHHLAKINEGAEQQNVEQITKAFNTYDTSGVKMRKQIIINNEMHTKRVCRRAQRLEEFFRLVQAATNVCWSNESTWTKAI